MSINKARRTLANQQKQLVHALTHSGVELEGFDQDRLRVVSNSLVAKRCRAAARAWPALANALGDAFAEKYVLFARDNEFPSIGGSLADGRRFAQWLRSLGMLPDEARHEVMAVDLRYRRSKSGLKARRGFACRSSWLRNPRRLLLAVRLPWFGECWLSIPFGRRAI